MTRSITPTQAGERLFLSIGPKFNEMDPILLRSAIETSTRNRISELIVHAKAKQVDLVFSGSSPGGREVERAILA